MSGTIVTHLQSQKYKSINKLLVYSFLQKFIRGAPGHMCTNMRHEKELPSTHVA